MFSWTAAAWALATISTLSTATWMVSVLKRDASIVDSMWSLFLLAAALVYANLADPVGPRGAWILALVGLWAIRLCVHLTWRNWGQPEDRRYQAIRQRNQPRYELKSLVYVFELQAVLAWIISWPLLPAITAPDALNWLDMAGTTIFLTGLVLETVADWQLARFKVEAGAIGKVMDRGLWRYSRHPNYFGECLVWWGLFGLALGAGTPLWTAFSPALITWLLIKVSGVPLLEKDLSERRPLYRDYISRTSAFVPWPPRPGTGVSP